MVVFLKKTKRISIFHTSSFSYTSFCKFKARFLKVRHHFILIKFSIENDLKLKKTCYDQLQCNLVWNGNIFIIN